LEIASGVSSGLIEKEKIAQISANARITLPLRDEKELREAFRKINFTKIPQKRNSAKSASGVSR
jgi:hypothetical protein